MSSSSKIIGVNMQIILVIIVTAIAISVSDNVIDSIRADQLAQETERQGQARLNQTLANQEEIKIAQEAHANYTKEILDKLTSGVDRQEEVVAKLDQIINNQTRS